MFRQRQWCAKGGAKGAVAPGIHWGGQPETGETQSAAGQLLSHSAAAARWQFVFSGCPLGDLPSDTVTPTYEVPEQNSIIISTMNWKSRMFSTVG